MKVLPEVVGADPKDRNFATGVAYCRIVALLIKAIKEPQKQIEILKSEIAGLKAR